MTFTKEKILLGLAKRKCKCGVVIVFYQPYPCICRNCGRKVYPTKKMEFRDKIMKEIKKK